MFPNLSALSKHGRITERVPFFATKPGVETPDAESATQRSWICYTFTADWRIYYPIHMVVVSLVQIVLFYVIDTMALLGLPVPVTQPNVWKVVGCLFAHVNAWHLWNNMLVQLTLGVVFEVLHGFWGCAAIYWLSGIFGTLFQVNVWATPPGVLLGASSAGYGLIGAYAASLIMNWSDWSDTPLKWQWFIFLLIVLIAEIVTYATNATPNIAHGAHLGGFFYGLCIGCAAVQNVRILPCETYVRLVAGIVTIGTGIACAVVFAVHVV